MRPLFKCHGGKRFLKDWIISHFPSNYEQMIYVEPFLGGGSVLLNKKPSKTEIANDIDKNVYTIWSVLQQYPSDFINTIKNIEYTLSNFNVAKNNDLLIESKIKDLKTAVQQYILFRMSRGGTRQQFSNTKDTWLRGGKPGNINAWETMLPELSKIANRIKNVDIYNWNGINFLTFLNSILQGKEVLYYTDPPYLHETRYKTATKVYNHEMTEEDHIKLANVLNTLDGNVILSGYNSKLYDKLYKDWDKVEKEVSNRSSQQKKLSKRTEVLFKNY